ncbi:hypothetical protein EEK96_07070 [Escherichia coli]|nr:hypothetical protein [Escherichia coli]
MPKTAINLPLSFFVAISQPMLAFFLCSQKMDAKFLQRLVIFCSHDKPYLFHGNSFLYWLVISYRYIPLVFRSLLALKRYKRLNCASGAVILTAFTR